MKDLGQLIITGIKGTSLLDEEKEFIQNNNIGGVILFTHNYEDPAQLAELVNDIQTLRDEYPLFVSVDNEGGRVFRFKQHFTHFQAMMDIAKLDSPKLVFEVHKAMAEELAACGVNLNYSPCCDVLTNPTNKAIGDRAFGDDPVEIEKYVSAAIRGLQTTSVLGCAKHFPGHGGTTKDSHFDLPLVKTEKDVLESRELIPFVKASKSRVEMIMMAHLMVDALNDELPTSLAKEAYDYCREKLKFKKIIITDDMEMKAISDRFSYEEAAVMAIDAGADIVLYRSMETAQKAYNGLKEAVDSGKLERTSIDEKAKRVLNCKKSHFAEYKPIYIPNIQEQMKKQEHQNLFNEIQEKIDELNQS